MNEEKKNINYSAGDIRNYLDGKLTSPDMRAMEKAALEDPFLADAIEGYEESLKQSSSFESGVTELQKRLAERINQKRRKGALPLWLAQWPVAASVLFVIGTAILTFTLINRKSYPTKIADAIQTDSAGEKKSNRQPSQDTLVKIKSDTGKLLTDQIPAKSTTKPTAATASGDLALNTPSRKSKAITDKKIKSVYPENMSTGMKDDSDKISSTLFDKRSATIIDKEAIAGIVKNKELNSPALLPAESLLQEKASGVEVSRKKQLPGFYVQGIVMNEKGDPVFGAAVTLAKSKHATTTDSNGYFKLYLKNQDPTGKLVFNSIGFQTFSTTVKSDSSLTNQIHLQTSSQSLNEVVVVGYASEETDHSNGYYESGRNRKKPGSVPDSVRNKKVQPVNGWVAFNDDVYKNKKIGTADSLLTGREVVSFIVDEKGGLSSFKVQKSISPLHDATVINLIKSTGWKILTGKKQKCTIAVPYE